MDWVNAQIIQRGLRGDRNAVLEMPYKLMITTAVLALVLPVVLESARELSEIQTERELEKECRFLASSITMLYRQGLGSTKTVTLNPPENTLMVSAGTDLNNGKLNDAVTIRYKIDGGELHRIAVKSGVNYISMCSTDNNSFLITHGGPKDVRLIKCKSTLDLNNDGIVPDYYIRLS
jgi:hypothetical protein